MFDFTTAVDAPVSIRIDGKDYALPRYLMPRFKAFSAARRQERIDEATEGMTTQERATWMIYYAPEPVDVAALLRETETPDGVEQVVGDCMERAGVPADARQRVLEEGDPALLLRLSRELTSAPAAAAAIEAAAKEEGEDGSDPLSGSAAPAGGDAVTGPASLPDSGPSTQEQTPTD